MILRDLSKVRYDACFLITAAKRNLTESMAFAFTTLAAIMAVGMLAMMALERVTFEFE